MARWEAGESEPRKFQREAIASVLGVAPDDLRGAAEPNPDDAEAAHVGDPGTLARFLENYIQGSIRAALGETKDKGRRPDLAKAAAALDTQEVTG